VLAGAAGVRSRIVTPKTELGIPVSAADCHRADPSSHGIVLSKHTSRASGLWSYKTMRRGCAIVRMRIALRFAVAPEVETILRELIADAEDRLAALEACETPAVVESPRNAPVQRGSGRGSLEERAG
jgi:hypothetical protein